MFGLLDLTQDYNQIQILEEDLPKTAFRMPFGHTCNDYLYNTTFEKGKEGSKSTVLTMLVVL